MKLGRNPAVYLLYCGQPITINPVSKCKVSRWTNQARQRRVCPQNTLLTFDSSKNKQTPWPESARELYRPSNCRLSAKLVPAFGDRGCHVVSVTDSYGHILGFLDWSRYIFFQVAPQLYSQGWMGPDPDPLLLRKSGSGGNRTRTSGSVARTSDHWTTETVYFLLHNIYKFS
jgi:hypothetical protein